MPQHSLDSPDPGGAAFAALPSLALFLLLPNLYQLLAGRLRTISGRPAQQQKWTEVTLASFHSTLQEVSVCPKDKRITSRCARGKLRDYLLTYF